MALLEALVVEPPQSFLSIASGLGIHTHAIRDYFPDLCTAIVERSRQFRLYQKGERHKKIT